MKPKSLSRPVVRSGQPQPHTARHLLSVRFLRPWFVASCFAVLSLPVSAATFFNDGGNHVINDASLMDETITISNGTTVTFETGAMIEGRILVLDTSVIQINGGQFGGDALTADFLPPGQIVVLGNATGLIAGGQFGGGYQNSGNISVAINARLTITGGTFGASGNNSATIRCTEQADVEISGGTFGGSASLSGHLQAMGSSSVEITGGHFGGTGLNSGIITAQDNAAIRMDGGTIRPLGSGSVQFQTFSENCSLVLVGCEFRIQFDPAPFGPVNRIGQWRLDGTLSDQTAFGALVSSSFPNTVILEHAPCNNPPVADAGHDQSVECTGDLTTIQLDGSGSTDPDGDGLSYEWSVPEGVALDDPTSATPTGQFPLGPTLVTLTVADGRGGVSTDDVLITVVDTTPPVVVCTTDLIALWPADHSLRQVQIVVAVTDECSDVSLICRVRSNEADDGTGDGAFSGDVEGQDGFAAPVTVPLVYDAELECFVGNVALRAERDGTEGGRTYSIACEVSDMAGYVATAGCVVVVPHDKRKSKP